MNILSIGNSFSQDAQRYLSGIAESDGVRLNCFNLYIGGCSLSRHYRNMLSDSRDYTLEMNGVSTGFHTSVGEALLNRDWDVVTVQQASHLSVDYKSYQPYLGELVDYVRECVPRASVALHQTWAYEDGSPKLTNDMGFATHKEMLGEISRAYECAAVDISADIFIPSGELFGMLNDRGIRLHRDTFHATRGAGRYALGLLWYAMLTGRDVASCSFAAFDEEMPEKDVEMIKRAVADLAKKYR